MDSYMPGLSRAFRDWWEGKYYPPENDPTSSLFILQGRHERHWTSRWARASSEYFKEHHRWIIGLLFGLLVAILVKTR
jgi:hypothetical protein